MTMYDQEKISKLFDSNKWIIKRNSFCTYSILTTDVGGSLWIEKEDALTRESNGLEIYIEKKDQ